MPETGTIDFKEACFQERTGIEAIEQAVKSLEKHEVFQNEQTHIDQHGEMKANLRLAYRHLEDARMRLGKAIQAFDGGKSCYPR